MLSQLWRLEFVLVAGAIVRLALTTSLHFGGRRDDRDRYTELRCRGGLVRGVEKPAFQDLRRCEMHPAQAQAPVER